MNGREPPQNSQGNLQKVPESLGTVIQCPYTYFPDFLPKPYLEVFYAFDFWLAYQALIPTHKAIIASLGMIKILKHFMIKCERKEEGSVRKKSK